MGNKVAFHSIQGHDIDLTALRLPDIATGSLKEECGLPFACAVQPFAEPPEPTTSGGVEADDIARCSKCFAYGTLSLLQHGTVILMSPCIEIPLINRLFCELS